MDVNKPMVQHSSASHEWYTPAPIIELARQVLGVIECDPASCAKAQEVVRAQAWFDAEHDGLSEPWGYTVWLNPPYGHGNAERWIRSLVERMFEGEVDEAITLLSAATGDRWFHELVWNKATAICWPRRIQFWGPDGQRRGQPGANCLAYYGQEPECFARIFRELGPVTLIQRGGMT